MDIWMGARMKERKFFPWAARKPWLLRGVQVHSQRLLNDAWNAKSHWRYHSTGRPPQAGRLVSPTAARREAKSPAADLRLELSCFLKPNPYSAVFTGPSVSSTCPLPPCICAHSLQSCTYATHLCSSFSCASESGATRAACFLLWGRKRTEGTASARRKCWLTVYQAAFLQE